MGKPVFVLLGAGASIPAIPGVADLTTQLHGWVRNEGLAKWHMRQPRAWYSRLVDEVRRVCRREPNFEEIIHALEVVGDHGGGPPRRPARAPTSIEAAMMLPRFKTPSGCHYLAQDCCFELLNWVDDACEAVAGGIKQPPAIVQGLTTLAHEGATLWVHSLNYDDMVEESGLPFETGYAPGGAGGARGFSPESALDLRADVHVHHQLHGSVRLGNLDVQKFAFAQFCSRSEARRHRRQTAPGAAVTHQDGRKAHALPLVTGLRKADKLLYEPYSTYEAALRIAAARASSWLVVGYGGGDHHVNAALKSAARWRQLQGGGLSVVVVDYEAVLASGAVGSIDASAYSRLGNRIRKTLNWCPDDVNQVILADPLAARIHAQTLNPGAGRIRLSLDGADWVFGGGFDQLKQALGLT